MLANGVSAIRNEMKSRRKPAIASVIRPSCGTQGGYLAHRKNKEEQCGSCIEAHRVASQRSALLRFGRGEFSKLPYEANIKEPLAEWRELEITNLEDGPYLSSPFFKQIRVPLEELEEPEAQDDISVNLMNASATYKFHHSDTTYSYFVLEPSSLRCWFDVIEENFNA